MEDNGVIETEFDPTTNALLQTIKAVGVTEEEIQEDMLFLVDLFGQVSSLDIVGISPKRTTEVLDCAYLGLLYHRHMPFKIVDIEKESIDLSIPEREQNDYVFTLNALSAALITQVGVPAAKVAYTGMEGGLLGRSHMRDLPNGLPDDDPDVQLHKQFLALTTLGMLIHRLLPTTSTSPQEA